LPAAADQAEANAPVGAGGAILRGGVDRATGGRRKERPAGDTGGDVLDEGSTRATLFHSDPPALTLP
jgi:hypothetical protein